MTSADPIRLWLVAGPGGDPARIAVRKLPASATARTEPTVTQSVEQHAGTVYRYALRLAGRTDVAEDLTQETLLRGWRSRGKLRDPQLARVWLLGIATNLWRDHLRQAKFRPRVLESEPPCPCPTPAAMADDQENVRRALAAMDELPPRQRKVMHLVTCEQLSHAEVAAVLEIEVSAVKANLSLARKEMRRRLKDVYEQVCGRAGGRSSHPSPGPGERPREGFVRGHAASS